MRAAPDYRKGLRERYRVERRFRERKRWLGLGRCRHPRLARYVIQGYLTAMVLNLRPMVKLLFSVSFRNQVYQVTKAS